MWAAFKQGEDFPDLGHAALDEEHEQISRLLNELQNAIQQRVPPRDQRFLLHQFEVYLRVNCREEEEMMEHDNYPNLKGHRAEHENLYRKLHEFERDLINGKQEESAEHLRNIRYSLLHHVRHEDSRIASWHRVQSISPDSPD